MDRKLFLQQIGLASLATALPLAGISKIKDLMDEPSNDDLLRTTACDAIPGETAGPYPYPGSDTSSLVRSDITEGQAGIPLSLTLTLLNHDNSCAAAGGLRVDIWHCNKRGYYSAYAGQPGIDGTVDTTGQTWLRGIQYTDSAGQVSFTTIYPGWYTPRATHIHVQVYKGTSLISTTQLCFPDAINTTVNAFYATSGTNPSVNSSDMVFSDSYSKELMTVSGSTSAGYTASMDIVVAAGTLGIEELSAETGGQFGRLNAYPNPAATQTTISFELLQRSDITLTLMDLNGKAVYSLSSKGLDAGAHAIEVQPGLPPGLYAYQLRVDNYNGSFAQTKKLILQ
jgi:protocatechuate 3,4-dioxygenase beta subunit